MHNTDTLERYIRDWYGQADSPEYDGSGEPVAVYDGEFDWVIMYVEHDGEVIENDDYRAEVREARDEARTRVGLEGLWRQ